MVTIIRSFHRPHLVFDLVSELGDCLRAGRHPNWHDSLVAMASDGVGKRIRIFSLLITTDNMCLERLGDCFGRLIDTKATQVGTPTRLQPAVCYDRRAIIIVMAWV